VKTQPAGGSWPAGYTQLGFVHAVGSPVAAVKSDGCLDVYVVGTDLNMARQWESGSSCSWNYYINMGGGPLRGDLIAADRGDGSPEVVAFTTSSNAEHTDWLPNTGGGTWSAWDNVGPLPLAWPPQ
jgi:hypothetical protein